MKPHCLIVAFSFAVVIVTSWAKIDPRNEPICLAGDDFFSAGPECFNFYSCRNGNIEIIDCPAGLLWNDNIMRCDMAENVQCEDDQTPDTTTEEPVTEAPTSAPTISTPSDILMPEVEGALPILLPGSECPEDIVAFLLHATDCQRFYYCLYGIQYPQRCPFLQNFDIVEGRCRPREESFCYPGSV